MLELATLRYKRCDGFGLNKFYLNWIVRKFKKNQIVEAAFCWFWQDWHCGLAGNSIKAHTIDQSICTNSCFENMAHFVTLKKCRSKIWVTKCRVQKTGSLLFKKRRGHGKIVDADWQGKLKCFNFLGYDYLFLVKNIPDLNSNNFVTYFSVDRQCEVWDTTAAVVSAKLLCVLEAASRW